MDNREKKPEPEPSENKRADFVADEARRSVEEAGKTKDAGKDLAEQVQEDAEGRGKAANKDKVSSTNTSFTPVQHVEGVYPPLLPDDQGNLKDKQGNIYRDPRPVGNPAEDESKADAKAHPKDPDKR